MIRFNSHILLFALFILFLFSACVTSNVTHDFDRQANWEHYFSFEQYTPEPSQIQTFNPIDQAILDSIQTNIQLQMLGKGYVPDNEPDLAVTFYIKVKKETKATQTGIYLGGGSYGYHGGISYGINTSRVNYYDYLVGTLDIHIIDTETNELVWQGAHSQTFEVNGTELKVPIKQAVEAIFERFKFMAGGEKIKSKW